MKTLNKYMNESLLSDESDLIENNDVLIVRFLEENYYIKGTYNIKNNIVDIDGDIYINNDARKKIKNLTNGLFRFGKITKSFDCSNCGILTSLDGAPRVTGEDFICSLCPKIINLDGAPEEVGEDFVVNDCSKLTSLRGLPKNIKGSVYCRYNKSLEYIYADCESVGGNFIISNCPNLKSLKGLPKNIRGVFNGTATDKINDYNELDKVNITGKIYFN